MTVLRALRIRHSPAQSMCSSRLAEPGSQLLHTAHPDTAPGRVPEEADSLRSPGRRAPQEAVHPPGSETAATHAPSSKHRPGSAGRSRPPAAERPDRAGGESKYNGSLWTPLRHIHLANHQPDAQPDQQYRPGILQNFAAPLPDQEQQSQGDQNHCANRLLAAPVNRWNRRHGWHVRIHKPRRWRIGRLIGPRIRRLLVRGVGWLVRRSAPGWSRIIRTGIIRTWIERTRITRHSRGGNARAEVAHTRLS